ncbi:MAG: hypothetical protein WAU86_23105 [Oricola sp.]
MFKLIRVGLAAACIQSIAVITAAILFAVAIHNNIVGNSVATSDAAGLSQKMDLYVPLLRYIYLMLAIGIILTHNRWAEIACEDVRRVSREVNPISPSKITGSVFGQLLIVTICFGIAVLRPPPYFVGAIVNFLEGRWIGSAIWSGAMSVAMVAFGVSAVAAKRAMQEPHTPRR